MEPSADLRAWCQKRASSPPVLPLGLSYVELDSTAAASRPVLTMAYVAPTGEASAGVSAATLPKTSAVRVESLSSVVNAVSAPPSALPTETRSCPGMSIVPTRKAAVSRTAVTLKVVARPLTLSEASISTPARSGKVSVYEALDPVRTGEPFTATAYALPFRVTLSTGFVLPRSSAPEARSVYARTRGKSSATATDSCADPMTDCATAGAGSAAAGSTGPVRANTADDAAATATAHAARDLRDIGDWVSARARPVNGLGAPGRRQSNNHRPEVQVTAHGRRFGQQPPQL